MQFDLYKPELHYMRGPGPKWHAKHGLEFPSLDGAIGSSRKDSEYCAPSQRLPSPMLTSSYRRMPTPSTKYAVAVRGSNDEASRDVSPSVKRAESMVLQTFKKWPNATFAAACAATVLSILFSLSVATSLVASSSSSASAEPPGNGCIAVSKGEYQGAYRKNLVRSRFGTYERVGHLGRYSYWYCR